MIPCLCLPQPLSISTAPPSPGAPNVTDAPQPIDIAQFARDTIESALAPAIDDGDVDEALSIVGSMAQILNVE